MMLLRDLLAPWFHYAGNEAISGITLDSRHATPNCLFVAIPGAQLDGNQFIKAALDLGATAVLVHTDDPELHGHVDKSAGLQIYFFKLNRQASALAAQFYDVKRSSLDIVGVTGTNGKTSVSLLMAQWVELMGHKTSVLGTLGNGTLDNLQTSVNTTADPISVMEQLHSFEKLGCQFCAMEVSSHGLVQARVEAVPFKAAVFLNLSREHLDYHKTMQAYASAKLRLFKTAHVEYKIINVDDAIGSAWFEDLSRTQTSGELIGYSLMGDSRAKVTAQNAAYHANGLTADIHWQEGSGKLNAPLLGRFNLANLVAALTTLAQLGYDVSTLLELAPKLTPIAGRMESFYSPKGFAVIVDYAHTPDALSQALSALRRHTQRNLWCVFGCGGDRDNGKRPLMGQVAESLADKVMITTDNPRSEKPQVIINDILVGLEQPAKAQQCSDRKEAIKQIIAQAQSGDIVLIAGKGHETYQEIAGEKHFYDEREFVKSLCEAGS